jgi:hypothetical protein
MALTDTDLLTLYHQLYTLQAEKMALQEQLAQAHALLHEAHAHLAQHAPPASQRELTRYEQEQQELAALRQAHGA